MVLVLVWVLVWVLVTRVTGDAALVKDISEDPASGGRVARALPPQPGGLSIVGWVGGWDEFHPNSVS